MKRIIAMLIALVLLCCAVSALAEGRTAPEDKKLYTTTDQIGRETTYRTYDKKFYDAPSTRPGTVVSLEYESGQYGGKAVHRANVYLPYGYDENGTERYPVLYFFHGTNETPDSFIGDEKVKNAVDNMIEVGIARPFILVTPTYYYDYENRALSVESFVREVRQELMPAVESTYRTYAETADAAEFTASRMQRAFGGYSRGGRMTWEMFGAMLDYAYWYLPMSGGFSNPEENPDPDHQMERLAQALAAQPGWDYFLYMSCGGKRDNAMLMINDLVNGALADTEHFSYGLNPDENNLYYCLSQEIHQTLISRFYLYNAFCDVLWRE
jgi:endo-1,4-beta-xylanase